MNTAALILTICCILATLVSNIRVKGLSITQQRFREYYQNRGMFNIPASVRENKHQKFHGSEINFPFQPQVSNSMKQTNPFFSNPSSLKTKPQVSNFRPNQRQSHHTCGVYKPIVRNFVANGKSSQHYEWPWYVQVIVKTNSEAFCGGTLISNEYVLTAAHCFDDIPLKDIAKSTNVLLKGIRLLNQYKNNYETIEANAVSVILNPEYVPTMSNEEGWRLGVEPGPRHDMALIKIEINRRDVRDSLMPACLPANEFVLPIGTKCKIMGHGFTDALSEDTFKMPKMLQIADVTISDNALCRAEVDSEAIKSKINKDTLCIRGPIHPCVGDSGGPLVCKGLQPNIIMGDVVNEYDYGFGDDDMTQENEEWYLTGVTSFAVSTDMNDKCGLFKSAVFGRVSGQREWIRKITGI